MIFSILGHIFEVIYLLIIGLMTFQAIFNIRLRLFIWGRREHAWLNHAPTVYREPCLSFTVLLPARHEEGVFRETLREVYDLNYPNELLQIIAICRKDDEGTIVEAKAAIDELGDPNVQLLIFKDEPINKPHSLNLALQMARGDVVTIFDAEDEPHPDILNIINTCMLNEDVDVVQSGVQLMNHNTKWFCFLNVLEYFFWFKSSMHFFAHIGMTPLGGNTVFVRRELAEQLGGWDEHCLTEDADLGIRLSLAHARMRIIYDDEFVTREETPHTIAQFIRQRTRWNQGFIQILFKGEWLRFEKLSQRLLAFYVLVLPELQAFFALLIPVSLVMLFLVKLPLWLAIATFLPLYCLGLSVLTDLAGLHEFLKAHKRKWRWREAVITAFAFFPYQWILGFGAMRAVYRYLKGTSNWEKTVHRGYHRNNEEMFRLARASGGESQHPAAAGGHKVRPYGGLGGGHEVLGPAQHLPGPYGGLGGGHKVPQPYGGLGAVSSALAVEAGVKGESEDTALLLHRVPNFMVVTTSYPDHLPRGRSTGYRRILPRLRPYHRVRQRLATRVQQMQGAFSTAALLDTVPLQTALPLPTKAWRIILAWIESFGLILGLIGVFAAHAINMFNYPDYTQDEGTYVSSAWAIIHGLITPYPYGYGHPPLAWMQLAGWIQLTGGFFTFGNALNSSRVLMLLYTLGSAALVYFIARKLTGSRSIGLLALVIFSFSPISITFQREVLLDNFATFWLLLSLYLLIAGKGRLLSIVFAAICFGISLLSKEVVVVLLPAMIYIVWLQTSKFQRTFSLVVFTYTFIAIGSTFILMAALRGELFPYAWHLPWDTHPHLSLLDTYVSQVERGQNEGSIHDAWNAWTTADPLLIVFGIAPVLFNLIIGWWKRKQLAIALLAISFWALLMRGGVIFAFYIIPLIPLIALNAALAIDTVVTSIVTLPLVNRLNPIVCQGARVLLVFGVIAVLAKYDIQHALYPLNLFTANSASAQSEALVWIRTHIPPSDVIVIDSTLYTDLHEKNGMGVGNGEIYPYAHIFWNVALDPEIHDTLLKGNWDRIDYIVADTEMLSDIKTYGGQMTIIADALKHSVLVASYPGDNYELVQIFRVIHLQPAPTG